MSTIQIKNMHEVKDLDIPQRTLERAIEKINSLNKIKVKVQGWIVDFSTTDKNGVYDESGQHITGYFIGEGDPRHGQLITTARIENNSQFYGYKMLKTVGINNNPYFLLEWED